MSNEINPRELYRCGDLRITICGSVFTLWRGASIVQRGKDWRPISSLFFGTAEMRAQRRFSDEARKAEERERMETDVRTVCDEDPL